MTSLNTPHYKSHRLDDINHSHNFSGAILSSPNDGNSQINAENSHKGHPFEDPQDELSRSKSRLEHHEYLMASKWTKSRFIGLIKGADHCGELSYHLLSFLTIHDLLRLRCVSKEYYLVIGRHEIWYDLVFNEYCNPLGLNYIIRKNLEDYDDQIAALCDQAKNYCFERRYIQNKNFRNWKIVAFILVAFFLPSLVVMDQEADLNISLWIILLPITVSWLLLLYVIFRFIKEDVLESGNILKKLGVIEESIKIAKGIHRRHPYFWSRYHALDLNVATGHFVGFFSYLGPLIKTTFMVDIAWTTAFLISALPLFSFWVIKILQSAISNRDRKDSQIKMSSPFIIPSWPERKLNNLTLLNVEWGLINSAILPSSFYLAAVYLTGCKLDGTVDLSWFVLLIPLFLIEIPLTILGILKGITFEHAESSRLELVVTIAGIPIGVLISTVLIGLNIDRLAEIPWVVCFVPLFLSALFFYIYVRYMRPGKLLTFTEKIASEDMIHQEELDG